MQENLVIVESPAKAKTIEKFLGKDYVVKSSFGHIRDLSKKGLGIDIDAHFAPDYEILPDKRKVVDEMFQHIEDKEDLMGVLLEMFMDASKSLLATDTEDKTAKNATWEIV